MIPNWSIENWFLAYPARLWTFAFQKFPAGLKKSDETKNHTRIMPKKSLKATHWRRKMEKILVECIFNEQLLMISPITWAKKLFSYTEWTFRNDARSIYVYQIEELMAQKIQRNYWKYNIFHHINFLKIYIYHVVEQTGKKPFQKLHFIHHIVITKNFILFQHMMKHFYIIIYTQNKELSYINFMCHLLKKDMYAIFYIFLNKNVQRKHVEYVAIFLFQFGKHFTEQHAIAKA